MPLEAPAGSVGSARGRGAVEAPFPREQAIKLRDGRGAPGAPRLVLGRAGRRRQGGVREGVTASPASQRLCSAPFLLGPIEGKVRACKPSGRRNQSDSVYSGCPEPRLTRPISGHWAFTWGLDWIQTSSFPVNLSVATLWYLGLPVTFFGRGRS